VTAFNEAKKGLVEKKREQERIFAEYIAQHENILISREKKDEFIQIYRDLYHLNKYNDVPMEDKLQKTLEEYNKKNHNHWLWLGHQIPKNIEEIKNMPKEDGGAGDGE
jgi:sulfur relay (sulfurtransferase) DsrC/TusE family protein